MRYGTPPVVRRTGGLADTVLDDDATDGTGFVFELPTVEACMDAMLRALGAFRDPGRFAALQRRAMDRRHDWTDSAGIYRQLYAEAARAIRRST
jgi:starch synthase